MASKVTFSNDIRMEEAKDLDDLTDSMLLREKGTWSKAKFKRMKIMSVITGSTYKHIGHIELCYLYRAIQLFGFLLLCLLKQIVYLVKPKFAYLSVSLIREVYRHSHVQYCNLSFHSYF